MKYETPEMTPLATAINAVQTVSKPTIGDADNLNNETTAAYQDWES